MKENLFENVRACQTILEKSKKGKQKATGQGKKSIQRVSERARERGRDSAGKREWRSKTTKRRTLHLMNYVFKSICELIRPHTPFIRVFQCVFSADIKIKVAASTHSPLSSVRFGGFLFIFCVLFIVQWIWICMHIYQRANKSFDACKHNLNCRCHIQCSY